MKGHFVIARLAILMLTFTPGPVWAAAALSESPTTAVPGATVVAIWSGIDTPTPQDWIGFYVQGAQDERSYDVNSWIYTSNCTQVSDTSLPGKSFGSCEFVLPDNLSPGVYELHLLANNGPTRLAKSNPFAVTGPIQIASFNIDNGAASTTSHTASDATKSEINDRCQRFRNTRQNGDSGAPPL